MARVEAARFDDLNEAALAAAFLRSHGLDAETADTGLATVDPLLQRALGGTRVTVPVEEASLARDLLAAVRAGDYAEPDLDPYDAAPALRGRGPLTAVIALLALVDPAAALGGTAAARRLTPLKIVGLALIALPFVGYAILWSIALVASRPA